MINVAVMGYGTIGSGVAEILVKNHETIASKAYDEVTVKYILDLREFPGDPMEDRIIHDFSIIEKDESIKIVVETMGGLKPAYDFVKACLLAGKHVVTSNKALVAAHGTELLKIAREKHINFLFEASVGGGIPIIRPLYRCLMGENIEEITGILNGTTNYILTKMSKEGESFEAALKQAQDLGYAERNPEADVEGYDTCRKIAILTAMATGKEVDYQDIYTEGITKITQEDFMYADKLNAAVKLFGSSRVTEDGIHAWVAPVMINDKHPLFAVNDVFNGILVKGNMLGTTMYYGSGAGKLPTASAVVADIIEAARHKNINIEIGWSEERLNVEKMDSAVFTYFVRIADTDANRAKVSELFGEVKTIKLDGMDEFAIVTAPLNEQEMKEKEEAFGSEILSVIRAEL